MPNRVRNVTKDGRVPFDPANVELPADFGGFASDTGQTVSDQFQVLDTTTGAPVLEFRGGAAPITAELPATPEGTLQVASNMSIEGGYIQSSNYASGSDGWAIDADGNAEFNDVTVRGTVAASQIVANTSVNLMPNGTFDTNTTGWSAESNCTIARATATPTPYAGAGCLKLTATASADISAISSTGTNGIPVTGGAVYQLRAARIQETGANTFHVYPVWYDSGGSVITTSDTTYGAKTATTSWENVEPMSWVAPSNAAYMAVRVKVVSATNGKWYAVDSITVYKASYVFGGVVTSPRIRTTDSDTIKRVELLSTGVVTMYSGGTYETRPGSVATSFAGSGASAQYTTQVSSPVVNGTQGIVEVRSGSNDATYGAAVVITGDVSTDQEASYATKPTAYTPALTASPTNPVLGTGGTATGALFRFGKLVKVIVNIHFGSGGGFTAGSGTYSISLPSTTDSTYYGSRHAVGVWTIRDGSSGTVYSGQVRLGGASTTTVVLNIPTGGSVTQADIGGGTWPSGTDIELTLEYLEA